MRRWRNAIMYGGAATAGSPLASVFVFAGQSNMRTSGVTVVPVELQTPDSGVKIWNVQTQAWETYTAGTNSETYLAAQSVYGPEGEFARLWRAAHPAETCYIIKYAKGGSSLETDGSLDWDPDHAELFSTALTEITTAMAALVGGGTPGVVRGVLWAQGESDALVVGSANAYAVNLAAFIAAVRAQWAPSAVPVEISRISDSSAWTNRAAVRAAQLSVADADSRAEVTSSDAYTLQGDNQHYVAASVKLMGADLYAAYAGSYVDTPTDITVTWRAGFTAGAIPEDTAGGTVIADLTATNAVVGGTVTFSEVSDPDSRISISGATLVLTTAPVQGASHNFTLRATNSLTRTYDKAFSLTGAASTAPTITSSATADNTSGQALALSLTSNQTVTWSIVGGVDQAFFEIATSTLRWLSNGTHDFATPVDSGANNTYVVTVRATNTYGETVDQSVTITVISAASVPTISVAPVISGNAQFGQTLSTTNGTWTDTPTSYTYQWKRGGSNIASATSSTYVLVHLDAGTAITCAVTAHNAAGDSSPSTSNTLNIDVYLVFLAHIEDSSDQSTYNGVLWQGVSLGTAAANRMIAVGFAVRRSAGAVSVSSLSVAGSAATLVKAQTSDAGFNDIELWGVLLAAGTSGTISAVLSATASRAGAGVWAIYGASGVAASATGGSTADPGSATLTVPARGVAIGFGLGIGGVGATWTGLTERYDTALESTALHSGADLNSTAGGSIAMSVDWSTTPNPVSPTAFATWGP